MQPSTVKSANALLAILNESPNDAFSDFIDQVCRTITAARQLCNLVLQDAERPDHEFGEDAALMDHLSHCPVCAEETCQHIEAMRRDQEPPTTDGLTPATSALVTQVHKNLDTFADALDTLDEQPTLSDEDNVHTDAIDDMSYPSYRVMADGNQPPTEVSRGSW